MADPDIQSPMDFWDYFTVILYRLGFLISGIMVAILPFYQPFAHIGLLVAVTLCASSLHIYSKQIRLMLQLAMWFALICHIAGYPLMALGAAFFTLGGLCFKEYFCFRVIGLNLQPLFLAILWLAIAVKWQWLILSLSLLCSLLLIILSLKKWQMPLHFDIGDKTKYQI